jgi:asparagine synthase (glutamine-hydrolysing)
MSGLCGWFSREPAALPIGQMAAGLTTDPAAARTACHRLGAVALAGSVERATLYHEDGLLIAHWGERVESLARLWRLHGAAACAALSGHFAFALLDERSGEALLAVDRGATRPLFYQQIGHTLVFASSADALALHPGAGREVDPQALFNYLSMPMFASPGSIYRSQRRLAPGEFVHMRGGRLERGRYWRLRFDEHQIAPRARLKAELLDTLRSALDASVGRQPPGVMLGGGAASAALAALLQESSGCPVSTFTAGTSRAALDAARRAARQLGCDHHERAVSASDTADAIPRLAALYDQPCGDPAALPAYFCALLAREAGALRLLAGHGAGVLFARGERYARQRRLARYERLPCALRQMLLEPLLFRWTERVRKGPLAAARARIEAAMQPMPGRLQCAGALDGYGAESVFEAGFLAQVDPSAPRAALEQAWWVAQARDQINRMVALDLQHGQRQASVMQACALAGVDVAFPYLHDAVLGFATRLAPHHPRSKLFGDALRGTLSAQLAAARGADFAPPLGAWLQSDPRLRGLAFDSLAELRRRRIVRADFIETLMLRLPEQPDRHARMVWQLMMLEQWFAQRKASLVGARPRLREPATIA